ncbi:MAG: HlyD family efflux transporter periplasmic adaptor subunit [Burkholderiales bacterium]|nr:HlyD family efflux transporter periplasmic adaptor subunit [Burkholderiales bacterium]
MSFDKDSDRYLLNTIPNIIVNKYVPTFAGITAILFIFMIFVLFLPWIQTSHGVGTLSTINPEDRLQPVVATINGRVAKWYVRDGSLVRKGDNIVELIDLDPENISRLGSEIELNKSRISALQLATDLSQKNYLRQSTLYKQGLTSMKEMEVAKISYQKNLADIEYYKSLLVKLETGKSRQQSQLIKATRDGFVVNTIASSQTNIVKVGDQLATFIPDNIVPAAEVYISGNDIPLVREGQKVRLVFDGWPSVQFSGWPSVAIGTFAGIVKVVDFASSHNGMFRVMVIEDPTEPDWPQDKFLRYGSRTEAYIQLGEVKLGYEIWRQINGFQVSIDPTAEKAINSSEAKDKK